MRRFAVVAMMAASLSACSWYGTGPRNHVLEAAVLGGIAGAIVGGVAGGNSHGGAAVGAGIGAAAGAAIAAALQR